MNLIELSIIALGVSMDAFAAAICKGLSLNRIEKIHMVYIGLFFGFFQALMPLLGYYFGSQFYHLIGKAGHWIAFVLLSLLGIKMIRESRMKEQCNNNLDIKSMILLSIATSIDAFAVGVTFACIRVNIFSSILYIGMVTTIISALGVKIGNLFGVQYKGKAELIGGFLLLGMGIHILLA